MTCLRTVAAFFSAAMMAACTTSELPSIYSLEQDDFVNHKQVIDSAKCSAALYLWSGAKVEIDKNTAQSSMVYNERLATSFLMPQAQPKAEELVSASGDDALAIRELLFKSFHVTFGLTGTVSDTDSSNLGLSIPLGAVSVDLSANSSNQTSLVSAVGLATTIDPTAKPEDQPKSLALAREKCEDLRGLTPEEAALLTPETDPLARNLLLFEEVILRPNNDDGIRLINNSITLTNKFTVTETSGGGASINLIFVSLGGGAETSRGVTQSVTFKGVFAGDEFAELISAAIELVN
ncbi:MAG: trypco2 family protein [Pseudomonadota bacterium]